MSVMQRAALLAALAFAIPAAHAGGEQEIARDGTVHRIAAGVELGIGVGQSSPILHFEQDATGEVVTRTLPGTELAWSFQPALQIDPVTDRPVVAWTRLLHGEADVFLSLYDGAKWSGPIPVALDASEQDSRPCVIAGLNLIQVVWQRDSPKGGTSLVRVGLDRATLGLVFGPEAIPTAGIDLIDPGADETVVLPPTPGEDLFVIEIESSYYGSDRVLIVFGIRDEPMPIGYIQGFILPQDVADVSDTQAVWVGDRILLSFVADDQLLYTTYENGNWSELRRINLGAHTSAAEARQQLVEMLERVAPGDGQ